MRNGSHLTGIPDTSLPIPLSTRIIQVKTCIEGYNVIALSTKHHRERAMNIEEMKAAEQLQAMGAMVDAVVEMVEEPDDLGEPDARDGVPPDRLQIDSEVNFTVMFIDEKTKEETTERWVYCFNLLSPYQQSFAKDTLYYEHNLHAKPLASHYDMKAAGAYAIEIDAFAHMIVKRNDDGTIDRYNESRWPQQLANARRALNAMTGKDFVNKLNIIKKNFIREHGIPTESRTKQLQQLSLAIMATLLNWSQNRSESEESISENSESPNTTEAVGP